MRRPFTDEVELRTERDWPLPDTLWTPTHLSAADASLSFEAVASPASVTFDASGDPVTFRSDPLPAETELTGPLAATLFVSSSTPDADLFVTLQAFAPDGREVEFPGTIDPHTPLAQGWLRASQRKIDPGRSTPHRPYHPHDEHQPLVPGEVYQLPIEIWPTCIVLPAGYRIGLQVSGHDFEREPPDDPNEAWVSRGSGPWLHTHPADRPVELFGGRTTIHTGADTPSRLLLPVVGPR